MSAVLFFFILYGLTSAQNISRDIQVSSQKEINNKTEIVVLSKTIWNCSNAETLALNPNGCSTLAVKYFANKTILLVGDSITRQWFFTLLAMLRGTPSCIPYREMQKAHCGNGKSIKNSCYGVCGCNGYAGNRTNSIFIWEPYMATNFLHAISKKMMAGQKIDVIIFTPGLYDVLHSKPGHLWQNAFKSSVTKLASHISKLFVLNPNLHFYWRLFTANKLVKSEKMLAANNFIQQFVLSKFPEIRVLDWFQYTLRNLHLFDDNLHHAQLIPHMLKDFLYKECNATCQSDGYVGVKTYSCKKTIKIKGKKKKKAQRTC